MAVCTCQKVMDLCCGIHCVTVCEQCICLLELGTNKGQDVDSFSLVPVKGKCKPSFQTHLASLSYVEVTYPSLGWNCQDLKVSCRKFIDFQGAYVDKYSEHGSLQGECFDRCSEYVEEMDNNGAYLGTPEASIAEESRDKRVILRKIFLQVGQKIILFLRDRSMMLLKCTREGLKIERRLSLFYWFSAAKPSIPLYSSTYKFRNERMHDGPNDRWPRYKCTASLDPRKIVLFFAIMSSMGSMLLIYLTLTVGQIGEGVFGE